MKTSYNVTQPTEHEHETFFRLGQRIRACRRERKLTLEDLASSIGATSASLRTWELGSPPKLLFLIRISEVFGLTLEELVFG